MSLKFYTLDPENLDLIVDSFLNNEIVTIFQDYTYQPLNCIEWLDSEEKALLSNYKSKKIQYRFICSRLTLKGLFSYLLNEKSPSAIVLKRNPDGRIIVNGDEDIFVSLSYSQNLLSISLAHRKIGTDVEFIRPFHSDILKRSPAYKSLQSQVQLPDPVHMIGIWTIIEAICKYYDKNALTFLNAPCDVSDLRIFTYIIRKNFVFSLVTKI